MRKNEKNENKNEKIPSARKLANIFSFLNGKQKIE